MNGVDAVLMGGQLTASWRASSLCRGPKAVNFFSGLFLARPDNRQVRHQRLLNADL